MQEIHNIQNLPVSLFSSLMFTELAQMLIQSLNWNIGGAMCASTCYFYQRSSSVPPNCSFLSVSVQSVCFCLILCFSNIYVGFYLFKAFPIHFCLFLSFPVCLCWFLFNSVRICPIRYVLSFSVHFYQILSVSDRYVSFCPFLSLSVSFWCFCPFLSISFFFSF